MPNDNGFSTLGQRYVSALGVRGFGLRFPRGLESEYLRYKDENSVWLVRLGCSVAIAFYAIFFILDFFTQKRLTDPLLIVAAFGIACPVFLVPLAATLYPGWGWQARRLMPYALAGNGLGLAFSIALQTAREAPLPYEVLVINLMHTFFLGGLLFRAAFPLACAVVATYVLADAAAGLPAHELSDHVFVLGAVLIFSGISSYLLEGTERRSWLRAQLVQEMAVRDELTGLHNRRYFYEQGGRLLRQSRRDGSALGLLLVDVDYFKRYNDTHGHLAGDECLRRIAEALGAAAQRPLDAAARLGGEEFALLMYETAGQALQTHAEKLRVAVATLSIPHPAAPQRFVSVSIGATAVEPGRNVSLDQLLAAADRGLYRAKSDGRDCVRYEVT